jgi:hypothetical protein
MTSTFQVIAGVHYGNNRVYKEGEALKSDEPLDQMFVGKFRRIAEDDAIPYDKPKGNPVNTRLTFVFQDAEDVTNSFSLAKEHKLKVYKDTTNGYAISSELVEGIEPLNLAPNILGSKQAVTAWLKSYIAKQTK